MTPSTYCPTCSTLLESSKHPDRVERLRLQREVRPFRHRATLTPIAMTAVLATLGANPLPAGLAADDENGTADEAETASAARPWLSRPRWWRQPPAAPKPPLLTHASDDRLTVSWNAPETLVFDIIDYDVQYRTADGDTFLDWEHTGTMNEATIVGLAESTAYEVRVRAAHELAAGDWSPPVVAATIEATPRFAEGESAVREIAENTLAGRDIGVPFHASAGARVLRYGLEGPNADAFAIDPDTGQLRTRAGASYDHESRPRLELTVTATDPRGRRAGIRGDSSQSPTSTNRLGPRAHRQNCPASSTRLTIRLDGAREHRPADRGLRRPAPPVRRRFRRCRTRRHHHHRADHRTATRDPLSVPRARHQRRRRRRLVRARLGTYHRTGRWWWQ